MKSVLIVDDAEIIRFYLKIILERYGYKVVAEADNGRSAIERYSQLKPDIVTMDIRMPIMDGIQAMKEIIKYDSKAKIVVISNLDGKYLPKQLFALGAIEYISKPFEDITVMNALAKIV